MSLTRRGFFSRLAAAVVAAKVAPDLMRAAPVVTPPVSVAPPLTGYESISFKGFPVVFDEMCPPGTIYLGPTRYLVEHPRRLGVITGVS